MAPTRRAAQKDIFTRKSRNLDSQNPEWTASLPGHQGNNSESTFAKGPEIVAALMDNIIDPHMLWQLVSASGPARRAFDHRPISYLKASLSHMPTDLYQLALVYIDVASSELCRNRVSGPPKDWPSINRLMDALSRGSNQSFSTELTDPLASLQLMSEAYEAIEALAHSGTVHKIMSNTLPFSTPSQHRIKKACWYLEIYSATFYRPFSVKSDNINRSTYNSTEFDPIVAKRCEFIHTLSTEELIDVARV